MKNKGQAMLEYILVSSFIGLFCLMALKSLGGVLQKRLEYLKKEIVEHVR